MPSIEKNSPSDTFNQQLNISVFADDRCAFASQLEYCRHQVTSRLSRHCPTGRHRSSEYNLIDPWMPRKIRTQIVPVPTQNLYRTCWKSCRIGGQCKNARAQRIELWRFYNTRIARSQRRRQ